MPQERPPREASSSRPPQLDERGISRCRMSRRPRSDGHCSPACLGAPGETPPQPAGGAAGEGGVELRQLPLKTPEASDQANTAGDCSGCGVEMGAPSFLHQHHILDGEGVIQLGCRHASCRGAGGSKACRRSRSSSRASGALPLTSAGEGVCRRQHHPLFCSVGVHGLPPQSSGTRRPPTPARGSHHEQDQQRQQSCEAAACDAQPARDEGKTGARCSVCGTLKAKAPSGFSIARGNTSYLGHIRKPPTCAEAPQSGARSGAPGRLPSCDYCGCLLSSAARRSGGPYQLLKQHQQPRQGEMVAGGVQWGHPTSFWLVESAREEGIEREFRRLFRINSPVSS